MGKALDPREDESCKDRNDGGLTRLRNRAFEQIREDRNSTFPTVHCFQRQSMGSVPFMGAVNPALHTQAVDAPFSSAEGLARKTPASAGQVVHTTLPETSFTRFSRVVRVSESYSNKRWKVQHREERHQHSSRTCAVRVGIVQTRPAPPAPCIPHTLRPNDQCVTFGRYNDKQYNVTTAY